MIIIIMSRSTDVPSSMTDMLRKALAEVESLRAVARDTGVEQASLVRFVNGEQSLRLDLADKLAAYFRCPIPSRDLAVINTIEMSKTALVNAVLQRLGAKASGTAHGGYTPRFPPGRKCEVLCRGEDGGSRSLRVGFAFNGKDAKAIAPLALKQLREVLGPSIASIETNELTYVGFDIPVPASVRSGFFDGVADLAEAVSRAIDPNILGGV